MNVTRRVSTVAISSGMALLLAGWLASPALAAVTNDRDYRFGGTGSSDGSLGANVGEGNPIGFPFSGEIRTADETGPSSTGGSDLGGFIDLLVPGVSSLPHTGATYTDTSARPLGTAGSFGARFDGADDLLTSLALNRPDEFATRIAPSTYPFEYTDITARGLQMWVRPDLAGLNAGTRQTIVMDTIAMGGVAITADGKWAQINDGHANDTDIGATVEVTGDTWYHVMQHVYPTGAPGSPRVVPGTGSGDLGFTGVVYVDGIAVSANNDTPDLEDYNAGGRVGVLSVGAAELADQDNDPETADFGEYYQGVVDDLQLYVFGDNSSIGGGQDYGTFDLFADNEWIANQISQSPLNGTLLPGDVNKDGSVTIAGDVPAFVAGWLSENLLVGAHNDITVGDWNTWGQGDMNLDGRVDQLDWAIIRAASPALAAAIANALNAVPEPSSAVLFGLASVLGVYSMRRHQHKMH